jgi:glutamate synthase (NADPH/NADH)
MGHFGEEYGKDFEEAAPIIEYKPYHAEKGYGWAGALPQKQGLYDPELEKDACGVGFAA